MGETTIQDQSPRLSNSGYGSGEWAADISRLQLRSLLWRYLQEGKSFAEARAAVRQDQIDIQPSDVFDSLVNNEFTIDPNSAVMASKVSERLSEKYPELEAIVLMGSAVNGGARIRQIFRSDEYSQPDFDWGVLTSNTAKSFAEDLIDDADKYLEAYAQNVGLNHVYQSCTMMNPTAFRESSLRNVDDARLALASLDPTNNTRIPNSILLYFLPSFPPEVNRRNVSLLKSVLETIQKDNPQEGERVIEALLFEWRKLHSIREKHFNIAPKERDRTLLGRVVKNSARIMQQPMRQSLQKTGK